MLPLIPAALSLAAEFAPTLIRKLAGDDAGDVAEKVVSAAQAITGTGSPEAAMEALKADPALAAKFRTDMATLEVELEKAYLLDRQDARKRDVAIRQAGQMNWRADLMIVCAVVALIFLVWQINARLDILPEVLAIYNMAIGALLKMLGDAFQFEFGSSRGSKEKDSLLGRQ